MRLFFPGVWRKTYLIINWHWPIFSNLALCFWNKAFWCFTGAVFPTGKAIELNGKGFATGTSESNMAAQCINRSETVVKLLFISNSVSNSVVHTELSNLNFWTCHFEIICAKYHFYMMCLYSKRASTTKVFLDVSILVFWSVWRGKWNTLLGIFSCLCKQYNLQNYLHCTWVNIMANFRCVSTGLLLSAFFCRILSYRCYEELLIWLTSAPLLCSWNP